MKKISTKELQNIMGGYNQIICDSLQSEAAFQANHPSWSAEQWDAWGIAFLEHCA